MSFFIKTYPTYKKLREIRDHKFNVDKTVFDQSFFEKNVYENIQQDTTRLFFDIDKEHHPLTKTIVKELVKQLDYQKESMDFVYTNGSTDNKISFHIVSKIYKIDKPSFNKQMAHEYLKAIFTEDAEHNKTNTWNFNDLFKAVDNTVYQKKVFMRLPWGVNKNDGKINPHIPNDVSDMKNYLISYVPDTMEDFKCEPVPEIQKIKFNSKIGEQDNGLLDPLNIKKYKINLNTLLEKINKQRFTEYEHWLKLLFLMKGRELEEEDFIRYSKESGYNKFDEEDIRDKWYRCDAKPMLGLSKVIEWCIEDGIDYEKLIYTQKEIKDRKKKNDEIVKRQKEISNKEEEEKNYYTYKEEFENSNAKILSTSNYITKIDGDWYIKKQSDFITAYRHLEYPCGEDQENKKFIGRWILDPEIKIYNKIDCIPESLPQNNKIFNTWIQFPKYDIIDKDHENICKPFLDHLRILCNHEEEVYNYVLHWFAHALKLPHEKIGIMLHFSSKEGAGKGLLILLCEKLFSKKNILDCPSINDILGDFNSLLSKKYLTFINELEFKQSNPVDGRLKALITDSTLTINSKGVDHYTVNSYHRFISFTNNIDLPIQTSVNDRRKLIIRASDEKCGDKVYGDDFFNKINNEELISSFYNYLLSLDVSGFMKREVPKTEYQKNIMESQKSPIELWLISLSETMLTEEIIMTGTEAFEAYSQFIKSVGIKLELSAESISIRLKNGKYKGVSDIIRGNNCRYRTYNKTQLIEHFNL